MRYPRLQEVVNVTLFCSNYIPKKKKKNNIPKFVKSFVVFINSSEVHEFFLSLILQAPVLIYTLKTAKLMIKLYVYIHISVSRAKSQQHIFIIATANVSRQYSAVSVPISRQVVTQSGSPLIRSTVYIYIYYIIYRVGQTQLGSF
jgi:hypothetical protein